MVSHNTRWVSDDLTGRVIDEEGLIEDGGAWEQVIYPEEAVESEFRLPSGRIIHWAHPKAQLLRKKGEQLHPSRYGPDDIAEAREDNVVWQALYQQNPTGGDAGAFTETMFERAACKMADIPESLTKYEAWDTAQSTKEVNDWSVGVTGGVDAEDTLWITDVSRDRLEPDELIDAIIDSYLKHHQDLIGIEKTQFVVGLETSLETRLQERRVYSFPYELLEHGNKDKLTRSRPIRDRMRRGKVKIPTDAPWFEDFKKELLEAFGGRYDDQADAFSYLGKMIDLMTHPYVPQERPKPKKSWRAKVNADARRKSWRTA